jgi:hypothetical protein
MIATITATVAANIIDVDWPAHDAEMVMVYDEHAGTISMCSDDFVHCHRCHRDPRDEKTCGWDVTDMFRCLIGNIVAAVSLAAAAQTAAVMQ